MKLFTRYKGTPSSRFSDRHSEFIGVLLFAFIICMFLGVTHQTATAQTVHIPDPTLRSVIESALGKVTGADITRAEMASLEVLQASRCRFLSLSKIGGWGSKRWICQAADDTFSGSIHNLTGLEFAINLIELHLGRNKVSDVSPLSNLTKLTYLDLGLNWQISDISPLKNLTNLTFLNLRINRISDISPLENLKNLIELDLRENKISDISPLSALMRLRYLDVQHNLLLDISPLSKLKNLTHLKT